MFQIVLVNPEIPPNTGNVARSVFAVGAQLHLVKPVGFSLDDYHLRRAGLDYWEEIPVTLWESFDALLAAVPVERLHLFSTRGRVRYDRAVYRPGDWLIFGSESRGLPPDLLDRYAERTRYLPMENLAVRSINLSSAAAVALFEALRQNDFGAAREAS